MYKINAEIRRVVTQHALDNPEQEVCGLIVSPGLRPIPCTNVYPDSFNKRDTVTNNFAISRREYIATSQHGDVIGCYHSHISNNPHFSLQDIRQANLKGDWWVLYHVPTNRFTTYQKGCFVPYVGREWIWTYQNCFTLFQSFYLHEFNHVIDDFYLDDPRSFFKRDVGYIANLPSQGLTKIPSDSELQRGDLLITFNGCKFPNHCMIVTDPLKSRAIHHSMGDISTEINYDGLQDIHSIWRLSCK